MESSLGWMGRKYRSWRSTGLRETQRCACAVDPCPCTAAEVEPRIDIPVAEDFLAARDRRAEQVINDALRVVVIAASDTSDISVEHRILPGHAVPALVELSKDADMIVAGSRGLGGVEGLLLGSVSSGLVHHAYCPVAVIHDDSRLLNDAAIAPVVVGVDGSPASELATAIAFDEASRRKAELVAVHTWMNHADFYVDVAWDAVATQAEEELAQRLAGWSERYPDVIVRRVVGHDNPVSRLLKESSAPSCWSSVVMGVVDSPGFCWVR